MKYKFTVYVFVSIFITALISSCSSSNNVVSNSLFQKRKYTKGWHINKNNISSNESNTTIQSKNITSSNPIKNEIDLVKQKELKLINENETVQLPSDKKEIILVRDYVSDPPLELKFQQLLNPSECSEIIRVNGKTTKAIILEVGVNSIKYKKCSDKYGNSYRIPKSSVYMIKYENGDTEVFNEEGKIEETKAGSDNQRNDKEGNVLKVLGILFIIIGLVGGFLSFAAVPLGGTSSILGIFILLLILGLIFLIVGKLLKKSR